MLPISRVHLPTVDSTNSWAKRNASSLAAGSLCVVTATEQTAGRGRGERSWVSSGGDDIKVTFSFLLSAAQLPTAYLLSPLLGVTACRALSSRGIGGCQLKWPNDLLMGGCRKVGGILCEAEEAGPGSGQYVVALGLGLNVNSLPEALGVSRPVWPLSTLRAEAGGAPLDVAALLEALVLQFAVALPLFLEQGFAPFQAEYEALSALLGKRVRMQHGEEAVVEGMAVGIAGDGRLLIQQDGAAAPTGYLSGEVSGLQLVEGHMVLACQESKQ